MATTTTDPARTVEPPSPTDVRKFHISLNVSDLARSVAFYRALFGVAPAKSYPDYAKFEIEEPALVLSLAPGPRPGNGGNLNHLGLRVRTSEELVEIQKRLEMASVATRREDGVACCYALQTKFWAQDPDAAMWEIYVLHEDIEEHGYAGRTIPLATRSAATPEAPRVAWGHRLSLEPIPSAIPHVAGSVDEISLKGTLNAEASTGALTTFLTEVARVLKPGGTVLFHGVAAAREIEGEMPMLPGQAAAIRHAPTRDVLASAMQDVGLTDVRFDYFGECGCLSANGVELHEVKLSGMKPKRMGACC